MVSAQKGNELRALYICYLSLDDPLVHTQVVAYLEGLADRGHTVHLLTFDPGLSDDRRRALEEDLSRRGIAWHSARYHKRPSLPATVYDVLVGAALATRLVRRHGLDAVHARNHVPAAMAFVVRRLTGCRMIFDLRGLMAEEYVDGGVWRRGGVPYRITQRIQRSAIRRADAIVVLTQRVRDHLFGASSRERIQVIPCCADLERLGAARGDGELIRARLGLDGRPVMVYVGKLTGRYMTREMVEFFAVARRQDPSLLLLVLTQEASDVLLAELERARIPAEDYRITRADPAGVGGYLAAALFAIYFLVPTFSEIAASPTKVGEYLGAGLPIVSGPGVGDTDALLVDHSIGVLVDEFSEPGYEASARRILELASDSSCRERCRTVAEEHCSLREVGIPRYDRVYREVAELAARAR